MKVIKTYETKGGKELQMVLSPTASLLFQFGSGGELPQELQGIFTSEHVAHQHALAYLNKPEQVSKKTKELTEE
jgi:hypothetical protein